MCLPLVCGADSIPPCRPVHAVHPDGYRTLDPSYRAHSRNQLDPYAAQPQVGSTASACVNTFQTLSSLLDANNSLCVPAVQVGRLGSAMELSSIPRFVAEPYGLEDDQRSMGFDEPDYGLGHPLHFSTVPRNHHAFPQGPIRRAG